MNPYKMLNVDKNADKGTILKAVVKAMKERKYPIKDIAIAQKILLNPVKKTGYLFKDFNFDNFFNIDVFKPQKINCDILNKPINETEL
jgi:hypothetical protein